MESYSKPKNFYNHKFSLDNFNWIFNLVEWIKSFAVDKSFRWDEWFWFGIVPAIAPYFFFYIWKKKEIKLH